MTESRSHVHSVFLPVELYIGLTKVMAEHEIGKSSAILLMVTEGLRNYKVIDERTYEKYKKRYNEKLIYKVHREETPEDVVCYKCEQKATRWYLLETNNSIYSCESHRPTSGVKAFRHLKKEGVSDG